MTLELSGPQQRELHRRLAEVFDADEFEQFLLHRMNVQLGEVAAKSDSLSRILFKTIGYVVRRDRWRELLVEARNVRPDSPGLVEFAEQFGLAPAVVIDGGERVRDSPTESRRLELKIRKAGSTLDLSQWWRRLGAIEGRVCRVEFPDGEARGTGFLVGPATVLTNYHVIEKVIDGRTGPRHVTLRFDHRRSADGVTVHAGTRYGLTDDWLVDASPYSRLDLVGGAHDDPGLDELDYALLRVDGTPGDDPIGRDTGDPNAPPRGWIEVPAEEYDFDHNPALHIVQHPAGRTIEVALDTAAVLSCNENHTRVKYTTPTEPGSSGSPCFGPNWQCVAMHQSGDPMYWQGGSATFNQGIPLSTIRRLTLVRGTAGAFGR